MDRKGIGAQTYKFSVLLSSWNKCFTHFWHTANHPVFLVNHPPVWAPGHLDQDRPTINLYTDKLGLSLTSHQLLHPAGFWYLAEGGWAERIMRMIAIQIPTCVPRRGGGGGGETWFDHGALQISYLGHSISESSLRQQERMAESVSYRHSILRVTRATENSHLWIEALKSLRTIPSRYCQDFVLFNHTRIQPI